MSKPAIPTARYYYNAHKESARQRSIPFLFTFAQWEAWWIKHLGPHWMRKRGCTSGKYVMARKGDKGPYAPWNVECITVNQNHSDTAKHGTSTKGVKNPMAKFTEAQIREIFMCKSGDIPGILRKHKIALSYMHKIKKREIWQHVTIGLPTPEFRGHANGESHGCATITADVVKQIYLAKGSLAQIARRFGVLKGRVHYIKTGRSWASVTARLGPAPYNYGQGVRTDLLNEPQT